MMDGWALMWNILFGSIGVGFFVYGKKQQAVIPLISGIILLICPYMITNIYLLVATGIVATVVPFVVKR